LSACRRAAADEARHARAMARLIERRGGRRPRAPSRAPRSFGSLFELALHNEREGVVGETWGALVAEHQAEHAPAEDVREAMRAIAREETEHAALSFRIARWARRRLGREHARALDDARREAFTELRTTLGFRPGDAAARDLGWPSRAKSAAMLDAIAPLVS
jgi:rubrerythrin